VLGLTAHTELHQLETRTEVMEGSRETDRKRSKPSESALCCFLVEMEYEVREHSSLSRMDPDAFADL